MQQFPQWIPRWTSLGLVLMRSTTRRVATDRNALDASQSLRAQEGPGSGRMAPLSVIDSHVTP